MEKQEYNNLIIDHNLKQLASIHNISDLVKYRYLGKYLIEYLLKDNIHTTIMDNNARRFDEWTKFYLKYNITSPLLNCELKPLLTMDKNRLLLDILLEKLNTEDRFKLYHNLKKNSYWLFRGYEQTIINIYANYGIMLPKVFIKKPVITDSKTKLLKKDAEIILKFCEAFKSSNKITIDYYVQELKKQLLVDHNRTIDDIQKLIAYKDKHKDFNLSISHNTEGEYNYDQHQITISPYRNGVFAHELSHLLYQELDFDSNDSYKCYERIRMTIDKPAIINKMIDYLKKFHQSFDDMRHYFEQIYYHKIKIKYGNYNAYIKAVYSDIKENHPEIIEIDDVAAIFYSDDNASDIVAELISIEKEEFINICTRNYYSEELMLENLLDALLMGRIFDGILDVICYSGHSGFDFIDEKDLSFNECLANYDAIKKSKKAKKLINDLKSIVGDNLIIFLNEYLKKNRGKKHEI